MILLTRERVYVRACPESADSEGLRVWSGAEVRAVFGDGMRLESAAENTIGLRLALGTLHRALKTGVSASMVVIKLTKKKGSPCLSLVCRHVSASGDMYSVTQDVPVELLTASEQALYAEPDLANPEVDLLFPSLLHVRNVLDRMRSLSDILHIEAHSDGRLSFHIQSDLVSVATHYSSLPRPTQESSSSTTTTSLSQDALGATPAAASSSSSSISSISVRVNLGHFVRFLACSLVEPDHIIICIFPTSVAIHALRDDVYMTYYLATKIE